MSRLDKTRSNKLQRAARNRSKITGTSERPRLSVVISNKHISAQIIDDSRGVTLASATTVGKKSAGNMTDSAAQIGADIAAAASKNKIKQVVFDRGAKKYHGRIEALANAAREKGLEF